MAPVVLTVATGDGDDEGLAGEFLSCWLDVVQWLEEHDGNITGIEVSLDGRVVVKALEEAIFMKPDYVDAHCDLASERGGKKKTI